MNLLGKEGTGETKQGSVLTEKFEWFDESDFNQQSFFFQPPFSQIEKKLKTLLKTPLSKLQSMSSIKAPEILPKLTHPRTDIPQFMQSILDSVNYDIDTLL